MSQGVSVKEARSCIACRAAAAKRARRVLFPRTSQPFFSFRTSAGSFLLAFPFLLREKKRGGRAPQWPGRYCRLFSLGINSGYILDTTSRTVSARTAMRGPGKRISRVNLPVFSGSRVGARDDLCRYSLDPASKCGMTGWPHRGRLGKLKKEIIKRRGMSLPKVRQTKAGIPWIPHQVRDDWETASGAIEQTKKVIIKKCGISLPKVRDDLCRYSLDPASKCGMTG